MTIDVRLDGDLSLVFSIPLLIAPLPELADANAGLRRIILDREANDPVGERRSNRGGWHSDRSLLSWPDDEIALFRSCVDRCIGRMVQLPGRQRPGSVRFRYRAVAWANVNRNGQYNTVHAHAEAHWAVVYYVSTGDPDPGPGNGGALELRDPRLAAGFGRPPGEGFGFGAPILIDPAAGTVVIFPAWVEHWVHPFFGRGERISIAINVAIIDHRSIDAGKADTTPLTAGE